VRCGTINCGRKPHPADKDHSGHQPTTVNVTYGLRGRETNGGSRGSPHVEKRLEEVLLLNDRRCSLIISTRETFQQNPISFPFLCTLGSFSSQI
jgi:hypothetical protein